MSKKEKAFIALVLILAGIFVYGLFKSDYDNRQVAEQCDKTCGVSKARVIEGSCHCMTEKGWERK